MQDDIWWGVKAASQGKCNESDKKVYKLQDVLALRKKTKIYSKEGKRIQEKIEKKIQNNKLVRTA